MFSMAQIFHNLAILKKSDVKNIFYIFESEICKT